MEMEETLVYRYVCSRCGHVEHRHQNERRDTRNRECPSCSLAGTGYIAWLGQ